MVCEQASTFAVIWNSDRREFTGIVTLRNMLELVISVCESLEVAWQEKARNSVTMKEAEFVQ